VAEWGRDTLWRQGHLLPSEANDVLGLRRADALDATFVVVATHDCDLAQSADTEPSVEVVVGRAIEKDGNCTHAKNARKLHLPFDGVAGTWVEFEATEKRTVPKSVLGAFTPRTDTRLSHEDHMVFQMWLASRYRRSAFADEFERRLTKETKLAEKIAKAVKPHGELIAGVFFDVDDGEEVVRQGPEDTYVLDITILHAADPDFFAAEKAASQVVAEINKAFVTRLYEPARKWQHIELRSCEAISESVLTYQAFKRLKRWRLEHISLASDPQQAVLAE
jgi:hypothetical protein